MTIFNNSQHPHLSLDLPSSGNFIIGLQWLQKGCNALEVSGCKRTVEAGTAQSPSAAARTNTSIFLFFSPISFSLFFSSLLQIPLVPITSSGNNRVYRGWGMFVGYYLPGNSPAAPPDHRAGGTTAHEEVQQSQFDPFPPGPSNQLTSPTLLLPTRAGNDWLW